MTLLGNMVQKQSEMSLFGLWESVETTVFNIHITPVFIFWVLLVNVSVVWCDGYDVSGSKDCLNEIILKVRSFPQRDLTLNQLNT